METSCSLFALRIFQSTHPVRGATAERPWSPSSPRDFNPRTPCGVRRGYAPIYARQNFISIHAPRAGCDATVCVPRWIARVFQSTHPVRGATVDQVVDLGCVVFQSTHPVRGATVYDTYSIIVPTRFQSTHPVRGATMRCRRPAPTPCNFNPRTPCGVRRQRGRDHLPRGLISIHAPRAGCDGRIGAMPRSTQGISIHAPRAGCDGIVLQNQCSRGISIHAPRAGCDHDSAAAAAGQKISIHAPRAGCDG